MSAARFDVEVDGRKYVASLSEYERRSVDTVRQQADNSREFGESSLNPMDLWRRSQDSWHLGAGVERFDNMQDQTRSQFESGWNIDPWERFRLKPAKQLSQFASELDVSTRSVSTFVKGNSHLFWAYGDTLKSLDGTYSWDGTAQTIDDLSSDGKNLYILAADGVYWLDPDSDTSIPSGPQNDTTGDIMRYVKGRLLVGRNQKLFDVQNLAAHGDASEPEPDPITLGMDLPSTSYWADITSIPDGIIAAHQSGPQATLYRIFVRDGSVDLTTPAPVTELPKGETLRSIRGYSDSLMIGNDSGFRLGMSRGGGVIYGPLVDVGGAVYDFAFFGKFAYFTANDFSKDVSNVGLGVIDLSRFTDELTPAWTIDITTDDSPKAIHRVGDTGQELWMITEESASKYNIHISEQTSTDVQKYEFSTGKITYGLVDDKVFESVIISHEELKADQVITITGTTDKDTATITVNDTGSVGGEYLFDTLKGSFCELTIHVDATQSTDLPPDFFTWTLRSTPIVTRIDQHSVPIMLWEKVEDNHGVLHRYDTLDEFNFFKTLESDRQTFTYKEWGQSYTAILDVVGLSGPLTPNLAGDWIQGTVILQLRTLRRL